jgi:NADPH:quinone reductase-like Zn-dependent oxidoreductase
MSLLGVLTGLSGPINTYAILHNQVHIAGVYVGSVAMMHRLVRALEATKIRPIIDRTFDFRDAPTAYQHLESGAHVGKVLITLP